MVIPTKTNDSPEQRFNTPIHDADVSTPVNQIIRTPSAPIPPRRHAPEIRDLRTDIPPRPIIQAAPVYQTPPTLSNPIPLEVCMALLDIQPQSSGLPLFPMSPPRPNRPALPSHLSIPNLESPSNTASINETSSTASHEETNAAYDATGTLSFNLQQRTLEEKPSETTNNSANQPR